MPDKLPAGLSPIPIIRITQLSRNGWVTLPKPSDADWFAADGLERSGLITGAYLTKGFG